MFQNTVYQIGKKLFSGTPVEKLAWRAYSLYYGFKQTGNLSGEGIYHVKPHPEIDSYPLAMDRPHRRLLNSEFEPEVFNVLLDHVDSNSVFWEIGARWGAFTYAMAPRVDNVRAFERNPHLIHLMNISRVRNKSQNVAIVGTGLSAQNPLDAYGPTPDIVTLDIEGSEYSVLPASPETLAAEPVWVVEAHEFDRLDGEPDDLIRLFNEYDYEVTRSEEQGERCRLVAIPEED